MKLHNLTLDGKPRFVDIEQESALGKDDENFLRQQTELGPDLDRVKSFTTGSLHPATAGKSLPTTESHLNTNRSKSAKQNFPESTAALDFPEIGDKNTKSKVGKRSYKNKAEYYEVQ